MSNEFENNARELLPADFPDSNANGTTLSSETTGTIPFMVQLIALTQTLLLLKVHSSISLEIGIGSGSPSPPILKVKQ